MELVTETTSYCDLVKAVRESQQHLCGIQNYVPRLTKLVGDLEALKARMARHDEAICQMSTLAQALRQECSPRILSVTQL